MVSHFARARAWVCGKLRQARRACACAARRAGQALAGVRGRLGLVWALRRPLLTALGVGAAVGLGCYLAGPVVASAVSGLAGFAGALLASALNALRRGLAGLQLHHA